MAKSTKVKSATIGKQKIADRRPAGSGPTVTVTQINSGAGRLKNQRQTLVGLGLGKLHRTRVLEDTPAVRGMIDRVKHLVRVGDTK